MYVMAKFLMKRKKWRKNSKLTTTITIITKRKATKETSKKQILNNFRKTQAIQFDGDTCDTNRICITVNSVKT